MPTTPPTRSGLRLSTRTLPLFIAISAIVAGCSNQESRQTTVRAIDEIQVVPTDEVEDVLAAGAAARPVRNEGAPEVSETTVPVAEQSRSFQARLGTALSVFNGCMEETGWEFVGQPNPASDDPVLSDPSYLRAVLGCAQESDIIALFQEQAAFQAELSPGEIEALNISAIEVRQCLVDRGYAIGPLRPNENGVLTSSSIDIRPDQQDAFPQDLDACGFNDLELG